MKAAILMFMTLKAVRLLPVMTRFSALRLKHKFIYLIQVQLKMAQVVNNH